MRALRLCLAAYLCRLPAPPTRRATPPSHAPAQYKDKPKEWVRVFLTFSNQVQPAIGKGTVRINNVHGQQVQLGEDELHWDADRDGPWGENDSDEYDSTDDSAAEYV